MFSSTKTTTKAEVIFVIGGPGSGKGTHCERLQKEKGYHHISTGDLIRNLLKDNADQTNEKMATIRAKVQSGELLDDQMITDVLACEMHKHKEAKCFLIDGYPRTLEQLALFENTIQECSKVLFFDTTESIMTSRLLKRADILHREDDNELTIARRIKVFAEKTLPVIDYIKKNKSDKFVQIDTSGTLEEATTLVNKALENNKLMDVNVFEFLACYLKSGNFYDAIDTLEERYQTTDFKVAFAFATFFYVIQNKEDVRKVLNANAVSGFQNHNFDVSHGHMLNINALPAFVDGNINPIWQGIHTGILHSVGNAQSVSQLVAKHFHRFLEKPQFALDVAFESFMESFWCEFMFGNKADADKFSKTRAKLISALRYSYYDSRLKNVPYLGTQACKLYGYLKKDKFAEIDSELRDFIAGADNCLFSRFRESLMKNSNFPKDKIDTAVLDNAFVLILALDFIQNAMYETLRTVVTAGLKTTEARKKVYAEGLHDSFLFPFRSRVPQEALALGQATVKSGTPIYINLLKSGLYHSAGPRTCAGIGVTQWIKDAIWDQLKEVEFELLNTTYPSDREKMSHSKDVPMSPERHEVSWHYSRDYLQKILPHHEFKGVSEFFDVLKIYEKPHLSHYVTTSFIEAIKKLNIDPEILCIATPEVRGVPAAAMVAEALQVPLVIIRKQGKIPGEVVSKKYSNAYSDEVVELSVSSNVKDKKVILIDDGIASGGTTVTCCDLIKQMGGDVSLILAMINHTYKAKVPELAQYPVQTLFDFASRAPKLENANVVPMPSSAARKAYSLFKPAQTAVNITPASESTYRQVM
ncbi:MAG: nucleoside monophosphate kinase [Gammaproteobacteria bacterium]|nr:nucleoside monophosphate kinase [Gammaproteobacteria bacterium]